MNIALIGNNDGPLRLARALQSGNHRVPGIGLQKVPEELLRRYRAVLPEIPLTHTPDETAALSWAGEIEVDLLINCFANFRFRNLHHKYDTLNVHPAPLPRYRGRHPIRWALINGEDRFGITLHRMTDDYDAGAIVWRGMSEVVPGSSAVELRENLMKLLEENFADLIDRYDRKTLEEIPNDPSRASYVTRRYPTDSRLEEWHDHRTIWRKVRALRHDANPAYLQIGKNHIVVRDARLSDRRYVGFRAGTVVERTGESITVVCGDGGCVTLDLPVGTPISINQNLTNA